MYPLTCALMLALMKPSKVATRSSTRGTSRGVTVVTRTSGAFGAAGAGLREQSKETATKITSAAKRRSRFIISLWLIANCAVDTEAAGADISFLVNNLQVDAVRTSAACRWSDRPLHVRRDYFRGAQPCVCLCRYRRARDKCDPIQSSFHVLPFVFFLFSANEDLRSHG